MVCQISTNFWNRTQPNKKTEINFLKTYLSDVGYAIFWCYKQYIHLKAIHKNMHSKHTITYE